MSKLENTTHCLSTVQRLSCCVLVSSESRCGPLLAAECCYAECWPATALGSSLRPGGQAPAQAATPCTTDILTAAAHYWPPTPRFFNEMTSALEMEGSNKYNILNLDLWLT